MIEALFFYLFAGVMLASGFMVVVSRNPVYSVLFLILAFFNAAGMFVLIGAEFLAMLLVVVYVGAVAVLFLFVVMMLDINFAEMRAGFQKYLPLGLIVGGILVFELVAAMYGDAFSKASLPVASEIRQYHPAWRRALHKICLFVSDCRLDPAGGDDWRNFIDHAETRWGSAAIDCRPEQPSPRGCDGNCQNAIGQDQSQRRCCRWQC